MGVYGPIDVSEKKLISEIAKLGITDKTNTCPECSKRLVSNPAGDSPSQNTPAYNLIRCMNGSSHVFHTRCFVKGLLENRECLMCKRERAAHVERHMELFLDSIIREEQAYTNYETKHALFAMLSQYSNAKASELLDSQNYSQNELELILKEVQKIGACGEFESLAETLRLKIGFYETSVMTTKDLWEHMASERFPRRLVDVLISDAVLEELTPEIQFKLALRISSWVEPWLKQTIAKTVSRVISSINRNPTVVLDSEDVLLFLKTIIQNGKSELIQCLFQLWHVPMRMSNTDALELASLYGRNCSYSLDSLKILCVFILHAEEHGKISRNEFLDAFVCDEDPSSERTKLLLEAINGYAGNNSCTFEERASLALEYLTNSEEGGLLPVLDTAEALRLAPLEFLTEAFTALLAGRNTEKLFFDYNCLFPASFFTLERDLDLLRRLIALGSNKAIHSAIQAMSKRPYYKYDAFWEAFCFISRSSLKSHLFTLLQAADSQLLDSIRNNKMADLCVERLAELDLYWCLPSLGRYVCNSLRYEDLLKRGFSNIIGFLYYGIQTAEYPSSLFLLPDQPYGAFLDGFRYGLQINFTCASLTEYLRCIFRTLNCRYRVRYILHRLFRNYYTQVLLRTDEVVGLIKIIMKEKFHAQYLDAIESAINNSELKKQLNLHIICALIPQESSLKDKDYTQNIKNFNMLEISESLLFLKEMGRDLMSELLPDHKHFYYNMQNLLKKVTIRQIICTLHSRLEMSE